MGLIHHSKIFLHAQYCTDDIIYTCAEMHVGNSLILFYPQGDQVLLAIPGLIQCIYKADGHQQKCKSVD